MLNILYLGSTSACFEFENDIPVTREKYTVLLNGEEALVSDKNVFSLFSLTPNTEYQLTVRGEESLTFKTKSESCCLNVRDFGAAGDGTDCTDAIRTAINCLPRMGRLFFPRGVYLTSPLCLKSNMTLELDEGAVILGVTDEGRYPLVPGEICDMVTGEAVQLGSWEGNPVVMHQSLIFAEHVENAAIVGRGTIDGNAQNSTWWQNVKDRKIGRPRLAFLNNCDNIVFHGITAQNSPSWHMHPYFSRNISFYDISVNAPKDSPNTDAVNPESCDGVKIIGCHFSVGDDCIAIKSGKIYMGQKYKTPANDHVIRNCIMEFGHGAVTLGSEMAGGVKNLTVNRCIFNSTDRGLRIKTRRGRGKYAVIDGITFENVLMDNVKTPIVINMWYNCCDPDRFSEYNTTRAVLPVDDRTPRLGKFCFRNMRCENCHVAACYCDGLPEAPIGEINVENITFTYSPDAEEGIPAMKNGGYPMRRAGMYFDNVGLLCVKNVKVIGADGEWIEKHNVGEYSEG